MISFQVKVIRDHEARKSQNVNFGFGVVRCMFSSSISVMSDKMIRNISERATSENKMKTEKKMLVAWNSVKSGIFDIQDGKPYPFFFNIDFKFCTYICTQVHYIYLSLSFLVTYSSFENA